MSGALAIRYRDPYLLVVDKPAGLLVHAPSGREEEETVASLLASHARGGAPGRQGIVHRLDRDTSGLLVVATEERTFTQLRQALSRRQIVREYLALVAGHLPSGSGTIEAPLGRDPRAPTKRTVGGRGVRAARTHFKVLAQLPEASLLALRLESGRTHQIRVHLRAIGYPLVGDRRYGGPSLEGLQRPFLHAARLAFVHPRSKAPLDLRSPLPDDLKAALFALQRSAVTIRRQ